MSMLRVPARLVAVPVQRLVERARPSAIGTVLGRGSSAAFVLIEGLTVAITMPGVPLMPNAVALAPGLPAIDLLHPGMPVRVRPGRLDAGTLSVAWDPAAPPLWDPSIRRQDRPAEAVCSFGGGILRRLSLPTAGNPAALSEVIAELLFGAGGGRSARRPVEDLLAAAGEMDPGLAERAAGGLMGRGGGSTPAGDDLLAAAAATVNVLGPSFRSRRCVEDWLCALLRPGPRDRTTPLAATLLELAAGGEFLEPVGALLDGTLCTGPGLDRAVDHLTRIGHSTGLAYACGIGAVASSMGSAGRCPKFSDDGP